MKTPKNKRLGDLLVEVGVISEDQLLQALKKQKDTNKKIGEILVDEGMITNKQIVEVLEFQLGIPHMDLEKAYISPEVPRLLPEKLARRHTLIPIKRVGNVLTVAMADPLNIFAIDDVKLATGLDVEPVISTISEIMNTISLFYEKETAEKALEAFDQSYMTEALEEIDEEELANIEKAPVVQLLNSIFRQAIKMKASDIHIEPTEKDIRVRFRLDGELQEIMRPNKGSHSAVVTRIKIMGKMNIAEKRVPQDGRVEMEFDGRDVDLRIAIMPTVHGEKVVIRLLDRSSVMLSKKELGFSEENLKTFDSIIQHPNGIILVTGPTGSGKTTTLYTVLQELNQVNKNIITVEDPVEYRINGINQSQVNVKAGLTFASGLRSILRQDPDIIMIGEIRDAETAQIAVRAAITGHLVLSTLHTNDTVSTIGRLADMGIEPYLLSSSIVGIMAQRLVKKLCTNCRKSYTSSEKEQKLLKLEAPITLYEEVGCNSCNNNGYKGRAGIHEILPIYGEIKKMIESQSPSNQIKEKAMEKGMITLRDSCRDLVLNGVTSVNELIRITYSLE
ncbi:GspE/PulE family protein [Tindallia californiensis]|uniref:Type II secretion system protein E (GspE) n=1 Tax=Tindallia californiensis TaxID=159292 RepID=A0A1H3NH87_9FIRM|nr:ATPase, T2SS/T4P/T4SS family [Tindallia californiensis]SDY88267.1 type II secretion system protein E (GspE) [Tindallia californiensis]